MQRTIGCGFVVNEDLRRHQKRKTLKMIDMTLEQAAVRGVSVL